MKDLLEQTGKTKESEEEVREDLEEAPLSKLSTPNQLSVVWAGQLQELCDEEPAGGGQQDQASSRRRRR